MSRAMQDVVAVKYLGGHRLRIRFDDGVEGELDFARRVRRFRGILAPLRDPAFFAKVFVRRGTGTVAWPGDLDFDTLVLYSRVTRRPIYTFLNPPFNRPPRRRRKSRKRAAAR
jgi:hypothetical protein